MNRLSIEVPIFFKLRMLWNGPLRNLATQPVSWPVKIETALALGITVGFKKNGNCQKKFRQILLNFYSLKRLFRI
jgi:hypothetical protein